MARSAQALSSDGNRSDYQLWGVAKLCPPLSPRFLQETSFGLLQRCPISCSWEDSKAEPCVEGFLSFSPVVAAILKRTTL